MNVSQNLAAHFALIIGPLLVFSGTWKKVADPRRHIALAAALAFVGGAGAWYASGYQAPHPFLRMQGGPMNPDLVFISTFAGLFTTMGLIAIIFGGHAKEAKSLPGR